MNMTTVTEVLEELKTQADPEQLDGMSRYGITTDKRLGIKVPQLRKIARQCGKDHQLALALWDTGVPEAMIIASLVDVPEEVNEQQMETWVIDFNSWDVCDQVCMNLFDKTPLAWQKINDWSQREEEYVKRAAYALIACLAWHDNQAVDEQFIDLLPLIKSGATDERNYVKKAVSWALRNIGKRNSNLNAVALQTAQDLKEMDSKSARWIGSDAVRDLTSEVTKRRLDRTG
jgi:3-methyladenine DNA glycosylase AlkD